MWLLTALRKFGFDAPLKASGHVIGLSAESGVWTMNELRTHLQLDDTILMERLLLVAQLLGLAIELPCIRFNTADERSVYTNVLTSRATRAEFNVFIEPLNKSNNVVEVISSLLL
jgi:hypothetical protein